MFQSRFVIVTVLCILFLGSLVAEYEYLQSQRRGELHYWQAVLAVTHHDTYGIIADYIEHECYDAALAEARSMRDAQVRLLADHLRKASKKSELLKYVKLHDPQLLNSVLSGKIPELNSFTTRCR
jgi:hypothetical protein